jgi:hypothetical protein
MHGKEQKDALDNLYNPAGFVGVGNGSLLYRWRADSHPFGRCCGGTGNPPVSGTQACLVSTAHLTGVYQAVDWVSDCCLSIRRAKEMPLINIVIVLIVAGVALWLINNFIPMARSIKTILNVVVVVAVAVWVLQAVGMWGRVTSYKL